MRIDVIDDGELHHVMIDPVGELMIVSSELILWLSNQSFLDFFFPVKCICCHETEIQNIWRNIHIHLKSWKTVKNFNRTNKKVACNQMIWPIVQQTKSSSITEEWSFSYLFIAWPVLRVQWTCSNDENNIFSPCSPADFTGESHHYQGQRWFGSFAAWEEIFSTSKIGSFNLYTKCNFRCQLKMSHIETWRIPW